MTPEVAVEILPWLSKALGERHKVILTERISQAETLRSLLTRLVVKHEGVGAMIYDRTQGILHEGVVIFVNEQPIAHDLSLSLKHGDRVTVTPFYVGG
jgi:molybdopterin converting factor small subunit